MHRQAILVVGMHRSGTSALTRLLSLYGAMLPAHPLAAADSNSGGFWESASLLAFNNAILGANGRTWHDLRAMPAGWMESEAATNRILQLAEIMIAEFGNAQLIAVKDPRLCIMLPLYTAALEHLGRQPVVVLIVRNPLEVAASLDRREGMSAAKALLLWLTQNLNAERDSRCLTRYVVTYGQLLADPAGLAGRIGQALNLEWPLAPVAATLIETSPGAERHHQRDDTEFLAPGAASVELQEVYGALLAAANGVRLNEAVLDAAWARLSSHDLIIQAVAHLEHEAAQRARDLKDWIDTAVERYEIIEDLRREIARLHSECEAYALQASGLGLQSGRTQD